jgi:hypothetical protein
VIQNSPLNPYSIEPLSLSPPSTQIYYCFSCFTFYFYIEISSAAHLANTLCCFDIPPEAHRGEDPRQIGFTGKKESVEVAKETVLDQLATSNLEKVYVHRISDAWEAEWNEISLVVPGQL